MKLADFEVRVLGWVDKSIFRVYPELSLRRFGAALIAATVCQFLERSIEENKAMFTAVGLLNGDEIDEQALRDILLRAFDHSGGLKFSLFGKTFTLERQDLEAIITGS